MTPRLLGAALAAGAAAAIALAWGGIGALGGTILWDYRYIILVVGTLLGLSLVDSLIARLSRWLEGRKKP